MSTPFLKLIAEHIYANYKDNVENLCIVLPNKRGALFLKRYLAETFKKTIWLPTIISAEGLIAEMSGLKVLEELDLMCHLYESYKACYGEKSESFEGFAKWGSLILQDFNEIDRYLADSEQLYENLKEIKIIDNWSLNQESLTEFQINYIQFMSSLGAIYKHYSSFLIENKWAYQGLAYKKAVDNLSSSKYPDKFHKVLFCGFNALNKSELKIFNYLLTNRKAEILWDIDEYYLKDNDQEAGFFLRNNLEYFKQKEPSFSGSYLMDDKEIEIISVPKQIGQAQVVKQSVQRYIDAEIPLDKVAIVLANEKLLLPVLQQLPEAVEFVNITMEYPLKYTSTYALIDSILQIQLNYSKQSKQVKQLYYKDLISLLRQPLFGAFLAAKSCEINTDKIINSIIERNISFIGKKHLTEFFNENGKVALPFLTENGAVNSLNACLLECMQTLQEYFVQKTGDDRNSLEAEYLEVFIRNLNRLTDVIVKYPHFNDIRSYKQLFNQVVSNGTAPFLGEPLRGLQIMGVLETRTLDFEHLIIVNVNESVLPSGKSVNSFIPNDLKRAFGMPLYTEKDAIYSYHFYRLLQRAKDITITYDSETDTFGKGEKSRFITQLQLELSKYSGKLKIKETVATAAEAPKIIKNKIAIPKTASSLEHIIKKSENTDKYNGLSPSALIVYKECNLKFYFKYGALLKETRNVEESAEANTFGSILHLCLENIYSDSVGKVLDSAFLKERLSKTDLYAKKSFENFFETTELMGKNILQYEVIKAYTEKLLKNDMSRIEKLKEQKQFLEICHLEKEFGAMINLNPDTDGIPASVYIKGTIDRIDNFNNTYRIIDYKNSIKASDKFVFTNFEVLFNDIGYNKLLQLVVYAWLLHKNNFCKPEQMKPGIIPFKEFLPEPKNILDAAKKTLVLTKEFFDEFEEHLKIFIRRIFDKKDIFTQAEDPDLCEFCAYNLICNR